MSERSWNLSMSNLSEKELEIALYIYIGQNIRDEGILVQDPFLVKNEKIVKELINREILKGYNWYRHSLLRINYNENVNFNRIIEGKLNKNKEILLESLSIIPPNLLSFFIHDYIENEITFTLYEYWFNDWKVPILGNERIQEYKERFFDVLIKLGFSVKTKSYVSTRGGELRDEEYVISKEIRDSLRKMITKIEIPNEIIFFSAVYNKILSEVKNKSGIIEFTIEEDEYLRIEMRLLEDAFRKILDKLFDNKIIYNYKIIPEHGTIIIGDAIIIHNFIVKEIDNTIIDPLISEKFAYKDEEKKLPSIFIAHSSADKFFARKLAEMLNDSGITVWIDEAEIKIGDSLTQKISKAIEETDFFGILISNDSVNSEWVKKELEIAIQKEIRDGRDFVYPILIDKVEIPSFLRDKHYADFTSPEKFVSSLRNLIDSIHSGKEKDVEPEPKYLPARSKTVHVTVHPPTLDAKTQLVHFEDIFIEYFDDKRSHNPDTSNDLYNIYLKLSAAPPTEWEKIFNAERSFPRHDRWRKAWIEGEYIIIYCIPEELEKLHDEEVRVDVNTTNDKYRKLLTEHAQEEALKESKEEKVSTRLRDLKYRLERTRESANESIIKRKDDKSPRARLVDLNQRIEADQNIIEILIILNERPRHAEKINGSEILSILKDVTGDNTRQSYHVKDAVAIMREENMVKALTSMGQIEYGFDQVWITPSGRNYLKIRNARA